MEDMYDMLKKGGDILSNKECKEVRMVTEEGINPDYVRKAVDYTFRKTNLKLKSTWPRSKKKGKRANRRRASQKRQKRRIAQ